MDNEGGNQLTTSDSGKVVRVENLCFLCLCVGLLFRRGWSEVLIRYTGKYVKIYFIIEITFLCIQTSSDYPAIMGLCCFRIIGYLFPLDVNLIRNREI